jgi:hypothetical protein
MTYTVCSFGYWFAQCKVHQKEDNFRSKFTPSLHPMQQLPGSIHQFFSRILRPNSSHSSQTHLRDSLIAPTAAPSMMIWADWKKCLMMTPQFGRGAPARSLGMVRGDPALGMDGRFRFCLRPAAGFHIDSKSSLLRNSLKLLKQFLSKNWTDIVEGTLMKNKINFPHILGNSDGSSCNVIYD